VRLAQEYAGKLHVIAIGPESNIASAFLIDRSLPDKVARLVMMAGAISAMGNVTHSAEFNMWADPESSYLIFNHFKNIELVSWEVSTTLDDTFNEAFQESFFKSEANDISKFVKRLISNPSKAIYCDPIAMAVMLDPSVIQEQSDRECYVEIHGNYTRGMLIVNWHSSTISHVRTEKNVNTKVIQQLDFHKIADILLASVQ
jgi:purine nucleosidase